MAVHSPVSDRIIRQHVRELRIGELIAARGITAGALSTLYELNTTRGHFVMRIMSDRQPADARYEDALLRFLGDRGFAVPRLVSASRPSISVGPPRPQLSVFQFLRGRQLGVFELQPEHARQVGAFIASMHTIAKTFRRQRRNRITPPQVARVLERVAKKATTGRAAPHHVRDTRALALELVRHFWPRELPRGVIHGDLFIDHARFHAGELTCVLGFENASGGPLLYDLAVALCDWAFTNDRFVPERAQSLVAGYQALRPLEPAERGAFYELCCFTAARFAIAWLDAFELNSRSRPTRYRDYRHFMRRLEALRSMGAQQFRDKIFGRVRRPGM